MNSIGNDIVALSTINQQRTNDIRFHSKFITPAELGLFDNQIAFEQFVWLLWSVKESAYKYQKRFNEELVFSPAKVMIGNITWPVNNEVIDLSNINQFTESFYTGELTINQQVLFFRSIINNDLIATIVSEEPLFKNIHWAVQTIAHPGNENQSRSVRESLLKHLQTLFPQGKLSLQKSPVGYPVLLIDGKNSEIPISLAHHEDFTSYCFKLYS